MTDTAPTQIEQGIELIREVPEDILAMPLLHRLADVIPVADILFGGLVLIVVVLIHAVGVRTISSHISRRVAALMQHPSAWHSDLLMASLVFQLLAVHLFEVFVWAAALVESGLVSDWRAAGFFAGNTYTTLGYGEFILPLRYQMVAPIMAISGLFTFGWSGSVLVDYVRRIQEIRDKAWALKHPAKVKHPEGS